MSSSFLFVVLMRGEDGRGRQARYFPAHYLPENLTYGLSLIFSPFFPEVVLYEYLEFEWEAGSL